MIQALKTKTCQNCEAWHCPEPLKVPRHGFCQLHPPVLVGAVQGSPSPNVAPRVISSTWSSPPRQPDDWCMDFIPKAKAENTEEMKPASKQGKEGG